MSEIILPSLITGGLALAGVIITNLFTSSNNNKKLIQENAKVVNDIKMENAKIINDIKLEITAYHSSTDEKIKDLTRELTVFIEDTL